MDPIKIAHGDLVALSEGHERLMHLLCLRVDDGMLEEIANADYGMDFEAHLAALTRIRDRAPATEGMKWEPHEVLALFRWSEWGDNRTGQEPRTELVYHLMRAFCCASLLEAYADPVNADTFGGGENQTLMQLLNSLEIVGPDFEADAIPFLAWVTLHLPDNEDEVGFFVLGLVWLLMRQPGEPADPQQVTRLIARLNTEEAKVRQTWGHGVGDMPNRWLLGTTHFSLRHKKWEKLGKRLGDIAADVRHPELNTALSNVARQLLSD